MNRILSSCVVFTLAGLAMVLGFSHGQASAGNAADACKPQPLMEFADTAQGPWKAPSKAQDPTPLDCAGECPDAGSYTGTCVEFAADAQTKMGNPPSGAQEFACACKYTKEGSSTIYYVFHVLCAARVQKNAQGEPIPWNGAGANDHFKCIGECPNPKVCTKDPGTTQEDDDGGFVRAFSCDCQGSGS